MSFEEFYEKRMLSGKLKFFYERGSTSFDTQRLLIIIIIIGWFEFCLDYYYVGKWMFSMFVITKLGPEGVIKMDQVVFFV